MLGELRTAAAAADTAAEHPTDDNNSTEALREAHHAIVGFVRDATAGHKERRLLCSASRSVAAGWAEEEADEDEEELVGTLDAPPARRVAGEEEGLGAWRDHPAFLAAVSRNLSRFEPAVIPDALSATLAEQARRSLRGSLGVVGT